MRWGKIGDLATWGLGLRLLRRERGLSQHALARLAGLSPWTISCIENGKQEPSPSTMRKLSAAFGPNACVRIGEITVNVTPADEDAAP